MNKKTEQTRTSMSIKAIFPFVFIAFGLTWGIASLMILFNEQFVSIFGEISPSNPMYILAVYSPAFAAIFLVWRHYGLKGLVSFLRRLTLWKMPLAWWLFVIFGTSALFYLASAITGTISDPFPFNPWHAVIPALLFMLVLGPVEEFGWRGLALPLLQRKFTPLVASVILGAIWGLWHLPAFLIGGTPQSEWVFVHFFIAAIALSIIMTAIFNVSKGSILIAALFHFQLNNPIWPDAQPWDTILFGLAALIIVIVKRKEMFTHISAETSILYPGDEPSIK